MPIEKPSSADSAGPFGGKGFGAADHDAVGHDKRDENPQRLIEAEGIGVDQHLHDAHHRGDNHYVDGDPDLRRRPAAQAGDGQIGQG